MIGRLTGEQRPHVGRTVAVQGSQKHRVPALPVGTHRLHHVADGQREQDAVHGVPDRQDLLLVATGSGAQNYVAPLLPLLHGCGGRVVVAIAVRVRCRHVVHHASSVNCQHLREQYNTRSTVTITTTSVRVFQKQIVLILYHTDVSKKKNIVFLKTTCPTLYVLFSLVSILLKTH